MPKASRLPGIAVLLTLAAGRALAQAPADYASFFVTSENPGKGGDAPPDFTLVDGEARRPEGLCYCFAID